MKLAIDEIAKQVLIETDNPAVMWGDCGLLDEIATRANRKWKDFHPYKRWQRVLNALEGSELFEKSVVNTQPGMRGNQYCRVFTLRTELFL